MMLLLIMMILMVVLVRLEGGGEAEGRKEFYRSINRSLVASKQTGGNSREERGSNVTEY